METAVRYLVFGTVWAVLASVTSVHAATQTFGVLNNEVHPVLLASQIKVDADSADSVRQAILSSAKQNKWAVAAEAPGVVSLVYPAKAGGKYELVMNVYFDRDSFRIRYVSSRNLDVRPCYASSSYRQYTYYKVCGHRNVNAWVDRLEQSVVNQLKQRRPLRSESVYR